MTTEKIIAQARVERDRVVAVLQAIEDVRTLKAAAQDESLSEAGEYLALKALTAAEEKLQLLVMSPGFEAYQRQLLISLQNIVEAAA